MIHICDNCYKSFKTTQHLNQHKNRKKKCESINNIASSSNSYLNIDSNIEKINEETLTMFSGGENNAEEKLQDNVILNYEEVSQFSNNMENLNKTENLKNNNQIENLSISNLLEFINTHKKVLEEKSKLESTLIILKKHIDDLTRENIDFKNRLGIVNNFIYNYRTPSIMQNKHDGEPIEPIEPIELIKKSPNLVLKFVRPVRLINSETSSLTNSEFSSPEISKNSARTDS